MSCPAFVTVVATALILQVTPVLDAQARRTGADPRALIERAVQSMGGEQALRGITTTTTEFNNVTFALGQEETPESPARATLASGRIVVDWKADRRVQVQEVRPVPVPFFLTFLGHESPEPRLVIRNKFFLLSHFVFSRLHPSE